MSSSRLSDLSALLALLTLSAGVMVVRPRCSTKSVLLLFKLCSFYDGGALDAGDKKAIVFYASR